MELNLPNKTLRDESDAKGFKIENHETSCRDLLFLIPF